jgi:GAF domain-containing protein
MDKVIIPHQQAGCSSSDALDVLDPLPFLARAGEMLAGSLDLEQTLDCLLKLVVPSLADFCSVHLLDGDGRLRRVAVRDRSDGVRLSRTLERWDAYGWAESRPVDRLLRRGTTFVSSPVRVADLDQIMGPGRGREVVAAFGMTSSMMVPLLARGRAIGILAMGTAIRPMFEESHRHLAEELARRAALAIDSARLYQSARDSRLAAERTRQRSGFLAEASAALAASLDVRTTLRTVVRLAVPLLVDACSVVLLDETGLARRVAAAHVDPVKERQMNETAAIMPIQTHPGHPVAVALAAGRPIVDNQTTGEPLSSYASGEYLEYLRGAGVTARMVVPLEARDRQIGALVLSMTSSGRIFEQDDVALGIDLAGRAALAIDNARLYEAAGASRQAAERARQRTAFLAEASATLATSLDIRTTLRTVVRLAVPLLVDSCTVVLLDDEGRAHRLASAHVDPAKQQLIDAQSPIMPTDRHPEHPVRVVARTGQWVLDNAITDETLQRYASGQYLDYLRQSGVSARLVVPLEARERRLGVLVLAMCGSGRTFQQDDVALGTELAGRAALAIDNARLYQEACEARERLERSEERLRRALTTAETMMLERQAEAEELRQLHQRLQRSLEALLGIHEVGTLLTAPSGLDAVGRRVLAIAVRAARLRAAALRRRPESGCRLRLWQRVGDQRALATALRASAMTRARSEALASGQAVAAQIGPATPGGVELTAWCIPLRVKGETIGVLEAIGEPRPSDEPTVEILGSIALQASTALENARLYREIAGSERALHRLVQQLMQAQEEERRRLAYEIHDGFAQMVYGLQQLLEAYAHAFPADSEAGRQRMEIAIELARRTVPEIRRVLAGLRPTVLDDFGLERGLCAYAEGLAGSGLRVTVESTLGPARLASPVEIALFRLAQEALTNVRKHAGASTARLSLDRVDERIVLEVEDRGGGFDQAVWKQCGHAGEHLGLLGMRERIAQIGGTIEIRSQVGVGTLVRAVVPVSDQLRASGRSDAPGRGVSGRLGADG